MPTSLFTISFTLASGTTTGASTAVKFSNSSTAAGYSFTSVPVTVIASAPTATVSLDNKSPTTKDTLTATATKSSVDGDSVSLTFIWKVNGVKVRTFTSDTVLTDTLDLDVAGNGDRGDVVTVEVTPAEGTISGATVSDSATVANTASTATVKLNTNSPKTKETLTATATKSDADGDSVSLTFVWTVNGVTKRTFTSSTALTDTFDLSVAGNGDKGDVVAVKVTPNDGAVNGTTVSSSATVANTDPIATVSLSTTSPKTNDTLMATATKSDFDSDSVSLTFVWTVNDVTKRTFTTTTSLTDTFDLSSASKGDVVAVQVTPNDGTISGTVVSASATIGNTAPKATVTTPTTMQSGDIAIDYSLTDPDADTCTIVVEYSIDGGATWKTTTAGSTGNGTSGLTSIATGASHSFVWASGSDIVAASYSNIQVRITPTDSIAGTAGVTGIFAVNNLSLSKQTVYGSSDALNIVAGQTFNFIVKYTTSDIDNTLTSLGLRIHYNSSLLTFAGLSDVLQTGYTMKQGPIADTANYDGDANTDKYIILAWSDTTGQWPNATLPADLLTVAFTLNSGTTTGATSKINFTSSSIASNHAFSSTSVTVAATPINLNINSDETVDATDGELMLRYLFGFSGDALIADLDADVNSTQLTAKLDTVRTGMLDVDGNQVADALTDGILVQRYLAGWTGQQLVQDAIGSGATRTDSDAIIKFLKSYMSTVSGSAILPTDVTSDIMGQSLLAAASMVETETATTSASVAATNDNLQIVLPDPQTQTVAPGSAVAVDINYTTSPEDATLSGLGLQVFYDSSKLTFVSLTDVLQSGYVQQQSLVEDLSNLDNDASTDESILIAWADSNNSWPNQSTVTLFTLNFTSSTLATDSTSINFGPMSTAADWSLSATSASVAFSEAGTGNVSGYVYVDANQTGEYFSDEGIPGVVITLTGDAQRTTTTDRCGYYEFTDLPAGTYSITETQPAACLDGGQHSISAVTLASDANVTDQNFRESGLRPGYIPNRVLATSSLPAGSTAWQQAIENTLAQAETASEYATRTNASSVVSQCVAGHEIAQLVTTDSAISNKASDAQQVTSLTVAELAKIVDAAIAQWMAAGLSSQNVAKLNKANISIADLPGSELGWTTNNGIIIDDDAAGYGWFVDPTPNANEEYGVSSRGQLIATDSAAASHMDLLTVVQHELGHFLGLDDSDTASYDLMSGTLSRGLRRWPETANIDAVLATGMWDL